ncbi:NAD(P)-dependent oxidoreductase [Roseococcus sp. DSY-14]|uniref:NAD(P)-dependent oxidoreductase n=1 Tax=Roseococcus sp. DSY-14 TaxID=3369650 RepID=UPI00387B45ED
MPPEVLMRSDSPAYATLLREAGLTVADGFSRPIAALPAALRERQRILVTSGLAGATAEEMALLPALGMVACLGTGFDRVDVAAATARGIVVTHGAGANATAVADHAMALLLAALRDLPRVHALTRAGHWRQGVGPRPIPSGKRLGILGMGAIGERVARRALGFEMEVLYHARTPRPHLPFRHLPTPLALAQASDHLVVALPGGPATRHLVGAAVLAALGPQGVVVNVGRGSVLDTAALLAALEAGALLGAALDVFEEEPDIPAALRAREDVVMTPHMAAWAPEARQASVALLLDAIARFGRGEPVLNAVPGALAVQPGGATAASA